VQVAQIYDGYSPLVFHWLEKLGFCSAGEAHQFVQGGRIALGGSLPLNTFGGALGEGRLHGMGHLREAALQAMGRGGARQVPGVSHSLVQVGIPERSWVLVLSAEP
jgi:acetyl-CoA acetyltransferase